MLNGLCLTIRAVTSTDAIHSQQYVLSDFNNPHNFQPVFIVTPNIVIPDSLRTTRTQRVDYPIKCNIELTGSVVAFDFDVMLVTDKG